MALCAAFGHTFLVGQGYGLPRQIVLAGGRDEAPAHVLSSHPGPEIRVIRTCAGMGPGWIPRSYPHSSGHRSRSIRASNSHLTQLPRIGRTMDVSPRTSRTSSPARIGGALARYGLLIAVVLATHLPQIGPPVIAQSMDAASHRPVIVILNGGSAGSVASTVGATPRFTYSSVFTGFAATLPQQAIDALRRNPAVASVEEDGIAMVTAQSVPTGVRRIGTTTNGTADIDGDGTQVDVDIAILDTGVDSTHPDLNVVGGKACVSGNSSWADDNGHGTKVAGVAAAMDNGYGVVGVSLGHGFGL